MSELNEHIWSQIENDNVGAYQQLFRYYYKELYFFARKFLANAEVAEEIVQDVFVILWQNRKVLKITKSIKSYLYTSVKNRSVNYLKSKINTINFVGMETIIEKSHGLSPDRQMESSELDEQIRKGIEKLPLKCREIFLLSRNSGMTYQEISDALGISKETVKSQISEALKRMRAYLDDWWEDIPA